MSGGIFSASGRFRVLLLTAGLAVPARGAEPPDQVPSGALTISADELPQLLLDLNADQYESRRRAVERLEQLGRRPDVQRRLADEYQRLLLRPDTPLEVREAAQSLRKAMPADQSPPDAASNVVAAPAAAAHDAAELAAIIQSLDDPQYNVRVGAVVRLEWLLDQPEEAGPILTALKQRLADPAIDAPSRRQLESLCEKARAAWLFSDPAHWRLPPVSDAQISAWLADYLMPLPAQPSPNDVVRRDTAQCELLDLLARDDYLPRVKTLLEQRRAEAQLDLDAQEKLDSLLAWTRPAMAAEVWKDGRHVGIQHLLLGVPNQPAMARRPSLFDRCDDHTAHCLSGNSLSLGDWPVGVFFPHPMPQDAPAQFHLVNLPTPRRRMAYEYFVKLKFCDKVDSDRRLAEISRRTLDALLAAKYPLSPPEIIMLGSIDATAVSRFVGPYLLAVDDFGQPLEAVYEFWRSRQRKVRIENAEPLPDAPTVDLPFRSSHAWVCLIVAQHGTHEAVPGLLQAIAAHRFHADGVDAPLAPPWIAALAIAQRDPWPQVDAWLAEQIGNRDSLWPRTGATVGASAAALLLERHDMAPSLFGLEPVASEPLAGVVDCSLYRFIDEARAEDVRHWWAGQRQKLAAAADKSAQAP